MADIPSNTPPTVQNKASMPSGILPRHTQGLVLGGLAFLMVAVIVFSGRNAPPENRKDKTPPLSVIDPSQARIEEYRKRIEEQSQKLQGEQAQLAQAKQAMGIGPTPAAQGPGPTPLDRRSGAYEPRA